MKNINELMADITAKVETKETFISLVFSLIGVFLKDFGGIKVLSDYFDDIDNGPHYCPGKFFRTCWYQKNVVDRETFDYFIKLTEADEFTPDSMIKLGHLIFTKNNVGVLEIPYSRKDDVELNQIFEKEWKCLFQNEKNQFIEMIVLRLNQGVYFAITKQNELLKKTFPDVNAFRASEFGYTPSPEAIKKAESILEELKNY